MSKHLDKAILVGMISAVIFTTLAHGAVEPWSLAIFKLLIIILTALWGVQALIEKQLTIRLPHIVLPLAGLLLWGVIQSLVYTDQAGQQHSLSMDVEATRQTITTIFILILALLLAAKLLANGQYLTILPIALTGYGFALALFGLIQHFAWDGRFYWWRVTTSIVTSPFGPFVTHNHFAGYLELLLPFPIALIVLRVGRVEARIFYGFAAALMGGAIIVSLSRGGFISLFAQMVFLAALTPYLVRHRKHSSRYRGSDRHSNRQLLSRFASPLIAIVVIELAIGLSVYWIGWEPVVNRIKQGSLVAADPKEESFFVSRGWIWRDTTAMIRANYVTGVGLGAFETVFPVYSQSDGSLQVGQAHNDYLQLFAETGLWGVVLMLWFIGIILNQVFHGLRSRDPLLAALALGSGGGIFGIMVHSIFDFNLQLPSHALLLVVLTAVLARVNQPAAHHVAVPARQPEASEQIFVNPIRL